MNFVATDIISSKTLNDYLGLTPKHSCTDGNGAWLSGPRNGTEEYIQTGHNLSVLSVCYDGWRLHKNDGRAPIRVRFCPWCGAELDAPTVKARKVPTAELQAAFPHLGVFGSASGVTA